MVATLIHMRFDITYNGRCFCVCGYTGVAVFSSDQRRIILQACGFDPTFYWHDYETFGVDHLHRQAVSSQVWDDSDSYY